MKFKTGDVIVFRYVPEGYGWRVNQKVRIIGTKDFDLNRHSPYYICENIKTTGMQWHLDARGFDEHLELARVYNSSVMKAVRGVR